MSWLVRHYRVLAAVVLFALMMTQIPARAVTGLLPGSVALTGVTGTIWSGQAVRGWVLLDGKPLMLGRVQWRLQAWRLGWSTPLTVTSEWGDQVLQARAGAGLSGRQSLRDVTVSIDIAILRAMFPLYLEGKLSGNFDRIEFANGKLSRAEGVAYLRGATWTANSGDIPLGDYRIDMTGSAAKAGVKGIVETEGGALMLAGELNVLPEAYSVNLQGSGPVARDDSFRRAVAMLATPSAEGFDIILQGQL